MLVEQLALAVLQDGMGGDVGVERMREAGVRGDARGDRHRPVDAGSDDPAHLLGPGELADGGLVLDGDHGAPVGVLEADRGGIAVAGDDVEPPVPCRAVQAELRRPRA